MAENIYCGKGKIGKFEIINVNLCLSDIPKELMSEYKEKKYIRLKVQPMKKEDDRGNTHTIIVDTWKPEPKAKQEKKEDLPW